MPITADFVAEERKAMGEPWVQQEYECLFTAPEGLVYPEFSKAYTDFWTLPSLGLGKGSDPFPDSL
jgi:hypothetical protein